MRHQRRLIPKGICSSCALFFIGILIYDYYQPHSNIYDQLSNENLSIEQVLEQMPICTSDDRSRQRALLHTLQEWTHLAQQHHIPYWIAYGTLVGYVQRHGLLAHDPHIDIFLMTEDIPQLIQISRTILSSTYKLKVHPHWHFVGHTYRSYFYSQGIDFITPNARFVNSKDNVYLNIWPIYDYNPNDVQTKTNQTMLTSYDKNYQWKSSPRDWTFPLLECKFSGIKVWCPAQPEKLVADVYGELSTRMASTVCVNGSWVKSNVYIVEEKKMIMNSNSITITIQSKSEDKTLSTTTSLNDFNLIEKALEGIPICTPNDRLRQRLLLSTFQAWAKLAEIHNLQYWITYGSLIGYVQRRGLLPHDEDLDVAVMADDTPKLIKMAQSNFSSDYELKIHPQWELVDYEKRSYFYRQGINFVSLNARFFHRKTNKYVDIYPAYDFNPLNYTKSTKEKQSDVVTEYGLYYNWFTHPRNWTYPLQTCYFSTIKLLCPAQSEKFIEAVYGVTVLTKSHTKCVNGNWVANN